MEKSDIRMCIVYSKLLKQNVAIWRSNRSEVGIFQGSTPTSKSSLDYLVVVRGMGSDESPSNFI